jgi:hypothetical protein
MMRSHSEIVPANINGIGSMHPQNANRADSETVQELQELLEHFTVKYKTDNPAIQPKPRLDLRADGSTQYSPRYAPQVPPVRERRRGISTNITAAIISLAMAAGMGWLLYTNPGLLAEVANVSAQAMAKTAAINKTAVPAPASADLAAPRTSALPYFRPGNQ